MTDKPTLAELRKDLMACNRMIAALDHGHDKDGYEDHAADLKAAIELQEQWERQETYPFSSNPGVPRFGNGVV